MSAERGEIALLRRCPHGDDTCPCRDHDPCHYERHGDTLAMPCPIMPIGRRFGPHCHVEGCEWGPGSVGTLTERRSPLAENCGLLHVAPNTSLTASYDLGCGLIRREVEAPRPAQFGREGGR